jgi:hypothetical protein
LDAKLLSWAQLDAQDRTWQEIDYTLDAGRTWTQLEGADYAWSQIEQQDMTWQEYEDLPVKGLTWGSLDGRFFSWEECEAEDLSWSAFENLAGDTATYRQCEILIPCNSASVQLRLAAGNATEASAPIETTVETVIPLFTRSDTLTLSVTPSQSGYGVQVTAEDVSYMANVEMTLSYDNTLLDLDENLLLADLAQSTAPIKPHINNIDAQTGEIVFCYKEDAPAGFSFGGLVFAAQFYRVADGGAVFTLSNR